jgi:hypothetical protein
MLMLLHDAVVALREHSSTHNPSPYASQVVIHLLGS